MDVLPCSMLDMVAVKGKTQGVKIYSVKRALAAAGEGGVGHA